MSAAVAKPLEQSSPEGDVQAILERWGWLTPPAIVRKQAELTATLYGRDLPEIAIGLNLITHEQVESLLAEKPEEQETFAWLAQHHQELYTERQRMLAIRAGIQYFDELDYPELSLHASMEEKEVQRECNDYGFVVLQIEESTPVAVFPDYDDTLRRFKQMSGVERATSAVRGVLGEPVYAVSRRESVIRLLRGTEAAEEKANQSYNIIYDHRLRAEGPVMRKLADLHDLAIRHGATDIHIDPDPISQGILVRYRLNGDVLPMEQALSSREYEDIKNYLLKQSGAQLKHERIRKPLDGNYEYQTAQGHPHSARCSYLPFGHGRGEPISIRIRLLRAETTKVDLDDLHLHPEVVEAIDNAVRPSQGLILLVGPTGSGKSTTIAGMLGRHRDIYGDRRARLSLEDPIERLVPGVTQIQIPYHFRHSGEDGFSVFFRNFLRHDPDLIWLGEIRDEQTAMSATHAATTGHMVVSTLHAQTPTMAVERLCNMMPPERRDMRNSMIQSLSIIIGQRLVKQLCPHCSWPTDVTDEDRKRLDYISRTRGVTLEAPEQIHRENPEGCSKCNHGFVGRLPVNEVLVLDKQTKRSLIYGGMEEVDQIEQAIDIRFETSVLELIRQGKTSFEALMF